MNIRARGIKQGNGLWAVLAMMLAMFAGSAEAAYTELTINSQPGNTTVYEGQPVKFVINATSSRTISYYWYKNGKRVGKNSNTLPVSNPTSVNAGYFTCKVADGIKIKYCTPFTFTVLAKPATSSDLKLNTQPSNATVYEGRAVTFSINATSSRAMTYRWTKNGSVIGTGSSLAISSAQTADGGSYGCSVSDGLQTLNCTAFSLTVNRIVRITTQPVSQMLSEGANASLSVAATGTAPISYQWYHNGTAISGATSSTLSFAPTATSNSGSYYCVVRNAGSNATSGSATLSVAAVVKTGSAMISWQAPTTRADGSTLTATNIAGYDLYHSADSANSMAKLTSLNANELNIVVDDLAVGTHYFALTTRDVNGLESAKSTTFSVNIR